MQQKLQTNTRETKKTNNKAKATHFNIHIHIYIHKNKKFPSDSPQSLIETSDLSYTNEHILYLNQLRTRSVPKNMKHGWNRKIMLSENTYIEIYTHMRVYMYH